MRTRNDQGRRPEVRSESFVDISTSISDVTVIWIAARRCQSDRPFLLTRQKPNPPRFPFTTLVPNRFFVNSKLESGVY